MRVLKLRGVFSIQMGWVNLVDGGGDEVGYLVVRH